MLNSLVNLLTDNTGVTSAWGRLLVVVFLFFAAWLLSRAAGIVASKVRPDNDGALAL